MRTVRLIGGTLQAASMTLGLFGMPLWLLALVGATPVHTTVVEDVAEVRVVYLPPPAGGGAEEVGEQIEVESTVDDALASPAGTPVPIGGRTVATAVGSGSGTGGGTGFETRMPRPDGAPDGPSAGRAKRERDCAEPTPGIAKAAAGSWTVDRDVLDTYAGHPGRIGELGGVGRHAGPDGKPDGFQLYGIQCGTPLHQAGLRSGDVVHAVNGEVVTNVLQAIKLYGRLKKADTLEVVITRRGERRTHTYRVS